MKTSPITPEELREIRGYIDDRKRHGSAAPWIPRMEHLIAEVERLNIEVAERGAKLAKLEEELRIAEMLYYNECQDRNDAENELSELQRGMEQEGRP